MVLGWHRRLVRTYWWAFALVALVMPSSMLIVGKRLPVDHRGAVTVQAGTVEAAARLHALVDLRVPPLTTTVAEIQKKDQLVRVVLSDVDPRAVSRDLAMLGAWAVNDLAAPIAPVTPVTPHAPEIAESVRRGWADELGRLEPLLATRSMAEAPYYTGRAITLWSWLRALPPAPKDFVIMPVIARALVRRIEEPHAMPRPWFYLLAGPTLLMAFLLWAALTFHEWRRGRWSTSTSTSAADGRSSC